ncbi:MAG: alanine:cation symporter family protein [Cyclobacteriaceae bacterium]|jgi:AGCS family alanine or glycine:cation symporter|nr:alanine:cation symporter family protein [Cyclobacteriaceae bacterium]
MAAIIDALEQGIVSFSNWIWGMPLLLLLTGGGLFFLVYSLFLPYRYFFHGINVLRGKYDVRGPGQLSPYQALSTALASTVGMGNIAGVAVAISIGGPGAIFWMWVSAFVGMATNFFTCAQASMFRGKDSRGEIQGGPMYVITEGLGRAWKPLAYIFCFCCLFGTLSSFQANQLTQAIINIGLVPMGVENNFTSKLVVGIVLTVVTAIVVLGGIQRIGNWAGKMVPIMIVLYFGAVLVILFMNIEMVPHYLKLIVTNAFTAENYKGLPDPITGGIVGGLIVLGVRRASFSNEAGIGTAPMALGATKSVEPIREGLVAMLSPAIDTLIVCTCTALAILVTGVWQTSSDNGVLLTSTAFNSAFPGFGNYILMVCIFFFAITSLFSYCYYGNKSMSFMIGAHRAHYYNYFYLAMIVVGAVASMTTIISLIDAAYAIMAFPTMISGIILAPRVMKEAKSYFARMKAEGKL